MKPALEYTALLFPMVWELVTDYIRIEKRKKNDNHAADIPVRIAMCIAVGFICKWFFGADSILQGAIYSATMFLLFDPALSFLRKKHWRHRGTNWTDQLWEYTDPVSEVFVRLWFLAVGWMCYYQWAEIVGR